MQGDINCVGLAHPSYWLIALESVKIGKTVTTTSNASGNNPVARLVPWLPLSKAHGSIPRPACMAFHLTCASQRSSLASEVGDNTCLAKTPSSGTTPDSSVFLALPSWTRLAGAAARAERLGVGAGDGPVPLEYADNTWLVGDSFFAAVLHHL